MAIHPPSSLLRILLPWSCLLAAATALAGPSGQGPAAPLPPRLQYTSAMAGYQAYTDQAVQSWPEANDRVGRIGGWRAYAKEAATGQPVSDPHAGHHAGAKR